MRKNYFLACAAMSLLTLAGCSNDDPVSEEGNQTGEQTIVLDMQDTDALVTKSRPLYSTSNKGAELVTDVKLMIFKIDDKTTPATMTFVRAIDIPNWNTTSSPYEYGNKRVYKLGENDKITEAGTYTILAVGQDETTEGIAPFKFGTAPSTLPGLNITAGATWNAASAPGNGFKDIQTNAIDYATGAAAEIFAGQSRPIEIVTGDPIIFNATVLLKRQVAGVLGYFSKIPAEVNNKVVRSIRLVSSVRNTQLDNTISLDAQADNTTVTADPKSIVNGFAPDKTKDAKFNGSATDDAFTVYEIDLSKWFKNETDQGTSKFKWSDDAIIDPQADPKLLGNPKGWINALKATNSTVKVADGSVLAGQFVIPFNKEKDKNTYELQLLAEDKEVLKSWKVKLDVASVGVNQDTEHSYSIYRNHLYQIGKRGAGDNPDNPGVDPDEPQPLEKDQELIIKINDRWEFIHDMEIE